MLKLKEYDQIEIYAPKNVTFGGGESLHFLYNELRNHCSQVKMVYVDFNDESFKKLPLTNILDNKILRILPEIYIYLAKKMSGVDVVIWWLSVGNFNKKKYDNVVLDFYRYFKLIIKNQRPIFIKRNLIGFTHWVESNYAQDYLKKFNIESIRLPRLLNDIFYDNFLFQNKEDIIVYNKSKSGKFIEKLTWFNDYKFVAIDSMNRIEVRDLLLKSRVYIDLGHFPGSERLPREAALLGNSIVIGRRGCAVNKLDFPISENFTIDQFSRSFNEDLKVVVEFLITNYKDSSNCKPFVDSILEDRRIFLNNFHFLLG